MHNDWATISVIVPINDKCSVLSHKAEWVRVSSTPQNPSSSSLITPAHTSTPLSPSSHPHVATCALCIPQVGKKEVGISPATKPRCYNIPASSLPTFPPGQLHNTSLQGRLSALQFPIFNFENCKNLSGIWEGHS